MQLKTRKMSFSWALKIKFAAISEKIYARRKGF